MATIDLIVLGMLKKEPMSAYDIQKLVEYRNISKWVKIMTYWGKILENVNGSPSSNWDVNDSQFVYDLYNGV